MPDEDEDDLASVEAFEKREQEIETARELDFISVADAITRVEGTPFALADELLRYVRGQGVKKADTYIPYYLASLGAHIANLRNRGVSSATQDGWNKPILLRFGTLPDLRAHLLFVAPPGWGKTLLPRLFMDARSGLLPNTSDFMSGGEMNSLLSQMVTWMTEAGLVGTFGQTLNRQSVEMTGDSAELSNSLYSCDEMSSFLMERSDYNITLLNSLLQILDEGTLYKRPSTGAISFMTRMTWWGGTQPLRVNLEHGLARRFVIIRLSPTKEDVLEYYQAHENSYFIEPRQDELEGIRHLTSELYTAVRFTRVMFTSRFLEWRDTLTARQHQDLHW